MVQLMVLDKEEILSMKKAITIYDAFKNYLQDPAGAHIRNRKGHRFTHMMQPIVGLYSRTMEIILDGYEPRYLPESYTRLLKKLFKNSSKIVNSYAMFTAGRKNIDNVISNRDDAIFDVMKDLYAYREGQSKKGRTSDEILSSLSLTTHLGIHLDQFD